MSTNSSPFPANPNQLWHVPNSPKHGPWSSDREWWYGLTLCGTTSDVRIQRGQRKIGGTNIPAIMPQRPAWVYSLDRRPSQKTATDFQSLVQYIAAKIGKELKVITTNYAIVETTFSCICCDIASFMELQQSKPYLSALDSVPTKIPLGGLYFPRDDVFSAYKEFLKLNVDAGGQPCVETKPTCHDRHHPKPPCYDPHNPNLRCKTVGHYLKGLFASLESIRTMEYPGNVPISWEDFPTQWPPEQIDGGYKIVSRPQDLTLQNGVKLVDVSVTLDLVMDTQGYCVPRGFVLDVDGSQVMDSTEGTHDELDDPPISSSSSSSSAYSTNASYEDDGGGAYIDE